MAPQEAPAASVKEQLHPRPSSGSELTKENATAGIISNESLTVRGKDRLFDVDVVAPFSLSSLSFTLTISFPEIKNSKTQLGGGDRARRGP